MMPSIEIRNPKPEARNKFEIENSNIQNDCSYSNFGHLDLSFDFAQDGELVEPFRNSMFGFCILQVG